MVVSNVLLVHFTHMTICALKTFAGGPLSEKSGNKLAAAGVKFYAIYGATEFGSATSVLDADDSESAGANTKISADWAWMSFSDRIKPRWVPEGDGTYELQLLVRVFLR